MLQLEFTLVLLAVLFHATFATDCKQIQDSQIFDGSIVYFPGNTSALEPLPANFVCIYKIRAPLNSSLGYYAHVDLDNGLVGVNDYVVVTDTTGAKVTINSRSTKWLQYIVVPGREMTVQVVTKSVLMNSKLVVTVVYHKANFGETKKMTPGNAMNYLYMRDLTSWDNDVFVNSITYAADEQIYLTVATTNPPPIAYLSSCFVIDGTLEGNGNVRSLDDLLYQSFETTNKTITIAAFQDEYFLGQGVVMNPLSESLKFSKLQSMASTTDRANQVSLQMQQNEKQAVEVVDFESNQIRMMSLDIQSLTCNAYVVDGPPNNSSKVILDLSKAEGMMPYTFNLSHFSVIAEPCNLKFSVRSLLKK